MSYCSKCGSQIPEKARFCPACAAPVQSTAFAGQPGTFATNHAESHSGNKRSLASAAGYWIGRHPIWTLLLLILFSGYIGTSVLHEHREPTQQADAKAQPAQGVASSADTDQKGKAKQREIRQLSAADKSALNLERTFKNNGYDIDARVDIDKSLVFTSTFSKKPPLRETEASELWKERSTLCGLDIWYVKVGYSKGMFSSDVTKTLSIGICR